MTTPTDRGKMRLVLFVCLAAIAAVVWPSNATVTVTVDPVSGNDTACLSLQQLANSSRPDSPPPCRTLNRALGSERLSCNLNLSCDKGVLEDFEDGMIILADGEHRLSGELLFPCI